MPQVSHIGTDHLDSTLATVTPPPARKFPAKVSHPLLDLLKIRVIRVGHRRSAVIPIPSATRTVREVFKHLRNITWTGHAEVGTYAPSGGLSVREGQIVFENDSLVAATLVIDMNSMTQSNPELVQHLKSPDFFDVEHYPTALIRIDRIADGTVFGTMTLKGKTAPFEAPVKVAEANGRLVIAGKVTLDRTQYGIIYDSASFFSSLGAHAVRNNFEVDFFPHRPGQLPRKYFP
jgi:polyisoprenoid-binding protein YceI